MRAALAGAVTLRRSLLTELALELDHADAGRVEGDLRGRGVTVLGATHAEQVRLLLAAPADRVDELRAEVAAATGGAAVPAVVGERWVDLPGARP
ncbi:DUF1949 domain-containing protein [Nocardioides zeicaulis]|uniref:DUF1949 domain-containing protein n=1 Tax=Nocardioides zeicaulis TaxID=1776857 RepID=A0ABV6DZ69_9ACTN